MSQANGDLRQIKITPTTILAALMFGGAQVRQFPLNEGATVALSMKEILHFATNTYQMICQQIRKSNEAEGNQDLMIVLFKRQKEAPSIVAPNGAPVQMDTDVIKVMIEQTLKDLDPIEVEPAA